MFRRMENIRVKQKKVATLIGRLTSPIIVSKTTYWKHRCKVKVVGDPKTDQEPIFTPLGKLVYGERDYPTILKGFRGFVKISFVGKSEEQLRKKLEQFLQKRFLGTKTTEGFGRVVWESCEIQGFTQKAITVFIKLSEECPQCKKKTVIYEKIAKRKQCTTCHQTWYYKKLKIRAGIRADYPKELQKLLIALMLHDFVHTEKHHSKIFQEIIINEEEIADACKRHHQQARGENKYQILVQYYDRLASRISRKKPLHTIFRYNKLQGLIDFKQLKQEIEERQTNHVKLYSYIHNSKELKRLVEALDYGKNPLRNHLLIMVNIAINDYYSKRLKVNKGNISLSASVRGKLDTAMDAERHSFTDHDNANSESPTNSKKRRLEA